MKPFSRFSMIVFIFFLFLNIRSLHANEKRRVAVPPFENLTGDPNLNGLSHGISSVVTTKLWAVPYLTLIERNHIRKILQEQSFQLAGYVDQKTAVSVGKLLGAETLVVGDFQKIGDQFAITARFVEVETGEITGTAQASGSYSKDALNLENEIAFSLLKTLGTDMEKEPELKKQIETKVPTQNLSAFEWCGKGDDAYDSKLYDKAIEYYTKALDIDGNYEDAYFSRGAVYMEKELYDNAIKDFSKTIQLNPQNADAYLFRAGVYFGKIIKDLEKSSYSDTGLYDKALKDLEKTMELEPESEYTSLVYAFRGVVYFGRLMAKLLTIASKGKVMQDEKNEMTEYATRIVEDLTKAIKSNQKLADAGGSFSSDVAFITFAEVYFARGFAFFFKRSWDDAIEDLTVAIKLDPDGKDWKAYVYRGAAYAGKGKSYLKNTQSDWEKAIGLGGDEAKSYIKQFYGVK